MGTEISRSSFTHYLLTVVTVQLLSACSSNVVSIDAKDSTTFTTLETSFPMDEQHNLRLQARVSKANGDYTQSVPAGKMIIIEGDQIQGPTDVSGSTELTYGSVSIGYEDSFGLANSYMEDVGGHIYFGIAQTHMDYTLEHQGTVYQNADRTTEFYWQLGFYIEMIPKLRAGATVAMSMGPDLTGIREIDLRLGYALFEHLEIFGGYRDLEYDYMVEEEDSTVRIEYNGPFIGLNVPF